MFRVEEEESYFLYGLGIGIECGEMVMIQCHLSFPRPPMPCLHHLPNVLPLPMEPRDIFHR